MLEELFSFYAVRIAVFGGIFLVFFVLLSLLIHPDKEKHYKLPLFLIILLIVLLPTAFFIGSTVYLNNIAISKGPVHWHADFEIWACGKEVELRDPKGFSNKIGTSVLHEHNDKRIHQEGVVLHEADVSLGRFFQVTGGFLTDSSIRIPSTMGVKTFSNGDICTDGQAGELQVFRYGVSRGEYFQEKLNNPESFVMAPYQSVPDGDCFVIVFDKRMDKTEKMCRSYQVAEQLGKIHKR